MSVSRTRVKLLLVCAILLLAGGCFRRTTARPAYKPVKFSSLSDYIRGIYKLSSEAGKSEQQRTALLSQAPELAPLVDRVERDPQDMDARNRIVAEYMSRNLYWGAYELLTEALANHANNAEIDLNLAVIWDIWGQYDLALQYGGRAIANGAATASAYETMGRIHLHLHEFPEAVTWYSRSLQQDRNASVLANIGYAHLLGSEWKEARVTLEEALTLDDTLQEAHNNLAMVLSETGDDAGAFDHLLQTGRPAVAFNNMGVLYLQKKMLREAEDAFQQSLLLEPDYVMARRNLDSVHASAPPPSIIHLP